MAIGAPRNRHPNRPCPLAPWGDAAPPVILPTARRSARAWALRPRPRRALPWGRHAQGASCGAGVPAARSRPWSPVRQHCSAGQPWLARPWPSCGCALGAVLGRIILRRPVVRGVAERAQAHLRPRANAHPAPCPQGTHAQKLARGGARDARQAPARRHYHATPIMGTIRFHCLSLAQLRTLRHQSTSPGTATMTSAAATIANWTTLPPTHQLTL